jgi:ubiquitin-like 1-activating enzyme E1 A
MLTETETQRYDRQIRVWGAEAQSRIKESKVLVCGLRGLNIEVYLLI